MKKNYRPIDTCKRQLEVTTKSLHLTSQEVSIGDSVEFEDSVTKEVFQAQLLSVIQDKHHEYAIFSIDNPNDTCDIIATYIEKTPDGFDTFADITDPMDLLMVQQYVASAYYDAVSKRLQYEDDLIALIEKLDAISEDTFLS